MVLTCKPTRTPSKCSFKQTIVIGQCNRFSKRSLILRYKPEMTIYQEASQKINSLVGRRIWSPAKR